MTALLDTNILIRHLTGDPPDLAERATKFLGKEQELVLLDAVLAECVFVLEGVYEVDRPQIAELLRSAIALDHVSVDDPQLLLLSLDTYEASRLHFVDAYLIAAARRRSAAIASFDRELDRIEGVERVEP